MTPVNSGIECQSDGELGLTITTEAQISQGTVRPIWPSVEKVQNRGDWQ